MKNNMIGVSKALQKVFEQILLCADIDSTILILGETGVGKELVARAILDALNNYKWNHSLAAKSLGIGRSTLWRKIKKYSLV